MPRRAEDGRIAREIANRIGSRAREARLRRNLTQENVSEDVGITSEALGRIERGKALPSFPTFLRLCHALRLAPDELLGEQRGRERGAVAAEPVAAEPEPPRELIELHRNAARLDRRHLRLVGSLVRELARTGSGHPRGRRRNPRSNR